MRIFSTPPNTTTPAHIVALWGQGLIGQAITRALNDYSKLAMFDCPFPWQDEWAQTQALDIIQQLIEKQFFALSTLITPRIIFVWSAGKIGFAATAEEVKTELATFNIVLAVARKLAVLLDISVEFHLLSSAGGLFEGCRYVTEGHTPQPQRLYGQLKLNQEQSLQNAAEITGHIYRVASVYGVSSPGQRRSLISVLVHHGIIRRTVTVVGTPATLRDYVHAEDLGHYVAQKILFPQSIKNQKQLYWMISGKPSSIFEINQLVEKTIRRRLYLIYQFDPENGCDITFSPELKPHDFNPRALQTGISQIYHRWQAFI
jgi:nucleoside-diphosphate-sugar epimerase